MKVVQFIGGLGNQMFQYSLFRNLFNRYGEVYYETFLNNQHNGFELDKVFNIIKFEIKNPENAKNLTEYVDKWNGFDTGVFVKDDLYYKGNWQNINYFPTNEILREDFSFINKLDNKNDDLLQLIDESYSISIHVRRGDYLSFGNLFFHPDWMNYYGLAINHLTRKISERPLKFFVFSDDIQWCQKNFLIDCIFVENKKEDSWKDLLLMSHCKHNIIANSTFSWWAAWLNRNPNKIVISPQKWVNDSRKGFSEINLNEWIKI